MSDSLTLLKQLKTSYKALCNQRPKGCISGDCEHFGWRSRCRATFMRIVNLEKEIADQLKS
jgi:hypothetical protein